MHAYLKMPYQVGVDGSKKKPGRGLPGWYGES